MEIPVPKKRRAGGERVAWIILAAAIAVIIAALIFFNFENAAAWMALNDPFQGQWASVQLAGGGVLYGHLAGVSADTIGLSDVYLLDTVTESSSSTPLAAAEGLSLSAAPGTPPQQELIPVNYTDKLYIERSAVLYFKFLAPDDPALPYLH